MTEDTELLRYAAEQGITPPEDPTQVWGLHFDSPNAVTLADVPGTLSDKSPSGLFAPAFLVAPAPAPAARVAFRGGWTCGCVATSLPLVEADMLSQGLIKRNIDIYQLGYRDDVAASAGTHSKGMMVDVGQYSAAQLKIWWKWGWNMQHRTPAQGFINHGHGGPYGCTHGSTLAAWQMDQYVRLGRDGLRSNGIAAGPTTNLIKWQTAVSRFSAQVTAQTAPNINEGDLMGMSQSEFNKLMDGYNRTRSGASYANVWDDSFGTKPDGTRRMAMEAIRDTVRDEVRAALKEAGVLK